MFQSITKLNITLRFYEWESNFYRMVQAFYVSNQFRRWLDEFFQLCKLEASESDRIWVKSNIVFAFWQNVTRQAVIWTTKGVIWSNHPIDWFPAVDLLWICRNYLSVTLYFIWYSWDREIRLILKTLFLQFEFNTPLFWL